METKTVYLYDTQGYYAGPHTLNERDDKTPVTHEWLIPANSTEVPMELAPKEHYLVQWNGESWAYVEDKNNPPTPEPEPPKPPTPEEKIAALDADYNQQKQDLINEYTDAQIHGDTETITLVKEEMTALDEWYDEEYHKIEEENEEGE